MRENLAAFSGIFERCHGCQACKAVCPQGVIRMEENAEGFLYPVTASEGCTACSQCVAVCPAFSGDNGLTSPLLFIGCRNRDAAVREKSSSGGVFPALARAVLRQGGVVYGAALRDGDGRVRHIGIEREEDIRLLQGSKYAQSDLADIPERLLETLGKKPVLFTGTPCQVAGIKRLTAKTGHASLTMEVICYGAGSPGLFGKYLSHLAAAGGTPESFQFRDKATGWLTSSVSYVQNGAARREALGHNPYTVMYFRNFCLRPSCHVCAFATEKRGADISVGDFKRAKDFFPGLDDGLGTSVVLCNTQKGLALWNEVRDRFVFEVITPEQAEQPRLRFPTEQNTDRAAFMRDMAMLSFPALWEKYIVPARPAALMQQLRRRMKERVI